MFTCTVCGKPYFKTLTLHTLWLQWSCLTHLKINLRSGLECIFRLLAFQVFHLQRWNESGAGDTSPAAAAQEVHSWWLNAMRLLGASESCALQGSAMLWTLLLYLQKNSVEWEHGPWHFSTYKPNSCYPECKLRVPRLPAVRLDAEMQWIP